MDKSQEQVKEDIFKFLNSHGVMTLATSEDNQPWVCTVYYGMDDNMNFYIVTHPDTKHGQHFEKNKKVAFNVFHSHQKYADLKQGVQGMGEIEEVKDIIHITQALMLWHKLNSQSEIKITPQEILEKVNGSKVYKITPNYFKYFNEELYKDTKYGILEL